MTVKSKSKTNQSTEEKDEKMKTIEDIRKHLDKYKNIKNSKDFTVRQKDILSLMLFRGNGQDEGFTMGYKHIMDIFGYSSTAISSAISLFKDYNFISVEKGHTGANSKYTLNYDAMKSFKSSSTVSVSDSEIREAKSEKRSKIREEKTYDTVIQLLTRLLSDLQIREEKRIESEKRYITDIQTLIRLLSDKFDTVIDLMNQRLNININNNINKNLNNLKDNISSNNNTEGNNIKDQNKKKNISTGNLEKLKENSKDENEIPSKEDGGLSEDKDNNSKVKSSKNENPDNENNIPSDENENTSKVESSKDENLNESRIPSDEGNISDNENPNDFPPLDVDVLFDEDNSNPHTEYRSNENLNEENETSRTNENSKEDENSSRSNGPSKEGEESKEDKDPSDENSKTNENPEDNEMDCSVFGDSNSTDEDKDKDNDKWYENSRSSKSDNHANGMFTNLISELTNNNNPKANEIPNDNNSKTSENMKKTKISTNTIPSEAKNPSDENPKTNENLNAFGKLQSFRDLKTGRIDGYQFNSYDNLNDSRDYSKSFHASVLCLNLEPSDLKVSVPDTGTWGILNRTNGVYSFIPSNVGPSYASNNALQASKTADVDNHTAEGEKVDSTQSPIVNKASDEKIDTPTDEEKDEKTEKTQSEDTPKTEIPSDGNETSNNALQATEKTKVDNHTTKGEKVDSTQSQNTNKASNAYADDLEDDAETIAIRERVMRQNAARAQQTEKKSDDKTPNDLGYYKRTPDGWKEIPVHVTMENKKMTMGEALELYKNFDDPLIYIYSIMRYVQDFCEKMRTALRLKAITDEQFNAFNKELDHISERYKAYWRKRFSYQSPNSGAEKDMHRWLGSPKVTQGKN